MFDSHCHLDFPAFDADREAVWARAQTAGVTGLLLPAYAPEGWTRLAALARELPGVSVALGVHPWALEGLPEEGFAHAIAALPESLATSGAVALGECGLDAPLARAGRVDLARQERAFEAQLEVARAVPLPVVLHVVGAHGRALACLERGGPLPAGGVLHSYGGSAELVPRYAALGLSFSFAAAVTRPQAKRPRRAAQAVPLGRLLVESDAPDQRPHGVERPRGEPRDVALVIEALAAVRGECQARLSARTNENARALFRL